MTDAQRDFVSNTHRAEQKGFLSLVCGAVMIGFAPIFMRLSDVGTTAAAGWRGALALPLIALIWLVLYRRGAIPALSRQDLIGGTVIGFFFAVDLYFWHWSVNKTTVANATLLSNLAALFTAIFSYFVLKARLKRGFFVGLALAFGGAVLLVGVNAEIRPDYLFGDLLAVLTAVAYATYILSVARYRQNMSTITMMLVSSVAMSVFLLPVAAFESAPFIPETPEGWWPLLWLGLISHAVGQGLIAYGLMAVPASLGSLTLLIQPVIAAAVAWMLFGEALGPLQFAGTALVLFGVYWAKRKG